MGLVWLVVISGSSLSCLSMLMMTLRLCIKLSAHLTRFSSSSMLRIFRRKQPLVTLGKVAATSMRMASVIRPRFHAPWVWAIATATASTADVPTLHPHCLGWKPLVSSQCALTSTVATFRLSFLDS